jgi:branched-chain amino acid transport system substrate-binding protein
MSRWRGYVVVAVAAALAAAGCTRSDENPGTTVAEVKIGLIAPLSGPDAAIGEDARRGAQFAADLVNGYNSQIPLPLAAQSGLPNLGGARIRITPGDINKAAAPSEVIRLANDGAAALVGATAPDATLDASLRAEKLQVPFVNADTGLSFTTERGLDWFFHISPSARTVGEAYFSLLKQQQADGKRVASVAVLHPNDKPGNDVSTVVGELAQEGGFTVAADVSYDTSDRKNHPVTDADLRNRLSQIQAKSPDAVFLAPDPQDVPLLADAFNSLSYHPAGLMTFGSGLADAISQAPGPSTSGMCRATTWSADLAERNPAARAVEKLYQSKFKAPMSEEAASTFTAVYTLALAINEAGSAAARNVRSSLLSLNLTGDQTIMPWDGIRFDETHQNQGAETVIEQFVNKGFRPVFPRDAVSKASDDLVWPAAG